MNEETLEKVKKICEYDPEKEMTISVVQKALLQLNEKLREIEKLLIRDIDEMKYLWKCQGAKFDE